mmetsp:Transcript_3421/g.8133  ORF Transcript_3421/g.8133 Transcript_3421/m.8133 type:complete len:88 (+) Transcript_3421:101-364(+)
MPSAHFLAVTRRHQLTAPAPFISSATKLKARSFAGACDTGASAGLPPPIKLKAELPPPAGLDIWPRLIPDMGTLPFWYGACAPEGGM